MKQKNAAPANEPLSGQTWEEVRRKLEEAQRALERGGAPPPEEKKAVFKARAERLAREPATRSESKAGIEVVEFLLANEKYAIESVCIREICPLKDFTPLPCTPSFILGIVSVRGQIISIVDLKKFFDLPERGLTELNKVIILQDPKMQFGILADAILGVRLVPTGSIQPPLPTLTGIGAQYLRGITAEGLIILDGHRILSDGRMVVHEEV